MKITLIDAKDNQIGTKEKLSVHRDGDLHRAFSVFIFNSKGEILLQKRSLDKYHSGGLWSNACCGHPCPGTNIQEEAEKRLFQEIGIKTTLKKAGSFHYKVKFQNGLIENEIDHVFVGLSKERFRIDPSEVSEARWQNVEKLDLDVQTNPRNYSAWFKPAYQLARRFLK